MLFESPFYVDFPITIGCVCGAFAALALWLLVVFNRHGTFHDAVVDYFHYRHTGVPLEKWTTLGRILFVSLAILFGTMALYCAAVATGVVENQGDSFSPERFEIRRTIYDKPRADLDD